MCNTWKNKFLLCLIFFIASFYSCDIENNQIIAKSETILMQKMDSVLISKKLSNRGIVYKKTIQLSYGNSITYLRMDYRALNKSAFLGIYYNTKFYLLINERTNVSTDCDSINDIQPYRKKYLDFVLTQMYIDNAPGFHEILFATNILYYLLDIESNPHSKNNMTNSMINFSPKSIQKVIREVNCTFLCKHFIDNLYRHNKINLIINGKNRILIQYLEPNYYLRDNFGKIDSTSSDFTPQNYVNIETYILNKGERLYSL